VEPINACATNTLEITPPFRQPNFSRRKTTKSEPNKGEVTGGASSRSSSQVPTPHGGHSSSRFNMAGHYPTMRLPKFKREASEDPEKHLFICENIWEAKQITDEDTKLA
jgi:hypothetical protein